MEEGDFVDSPAWRFQSGAEDARSPNALRLLNAGGLREAFGVRTIYRRFPPAALERIKPAPKLEAVEDAG